jgi:hypothetical protein
MLLGRDDLMPSALHSLLSCTVIFKGGCGELCHLVSNIKGNGYLALYQIFRMVHLVLGQTTYQPAQPLHTKTHSFSENVTNYLDYFQLKECSGRIYPLNERIVLIIS